MKHQNIGYTLIELLVAISIIGIVSAWAIPSFQHSNKARLADKAAADIQNALSLARLTAISRGETAIVCPSADGKSCDNGTDWSQGAIAFVDINKTGAFEAAVEEVEIIERVYGAKNGATITSTRSRPVKFNAFGLARGSNQSIAYAGVDKQTEYNRKVVINRQGRIRLEKYKDL